MLTTAALAIFLPPRRISLLRNPNFNLTVITTVFRRYNHHPPIMPPLPTCLIAQYASSGRATCKTCSNIIDKEALRLGVVTKDKRLGFEMTRWHHFNCLPAESVDINSSESVTGFNSLKSDDQEALKKFVDDCVEAKDSNKDVAAEDKPKSVKKVKVKDTAEGVPDKDKPKSIKKRKNKDRDEGMDSLEKEPKKLQLSVSDDAEVEIVLELSDVKDMYKVATLLPNWRAFQSIIFLEKDEGLKDSSKIAAFDFDGCLANTDVKMFKTGADKWSLMYPSIPDKLQNLYNDGFKLVIFTNESNIDRWTKKRQKAVDSKVGRLNNFIKQVNLPIQVFIACGFDKANKNDAYRKPQSGMWRVMEKYFNFGIPIDMDQKFVVLPEVFYLADASYFVHTSFYVGDAAGRPSDHSDADIKFAQTIGLKFYLPEEFFETKD